jgi:glycosyltransferase involved in cell wall biosynthesis
MHVLKILRGFHLDGPGRLVLSLLREWRAADVRVSVAALSQEGALREDVEREVRRLRGKVVVVPTAWRDVSRSARRVAALAEAIGATHLHAHLLRPEVVARMAAWRAGLPALSTEHGIHAWDERGRWLRPAVRRWYLHSLTPDTHICAVSEKVARDLRREGVPPQAISVIGNGVDVDHFCSASEERRRAARAALGIPAEAGPVLLTVGALREEKEPQLMLSAVAAMERKLGRDARGIFCGDGPLLNALRRRARELGIADRIHFAGAVDDVRPYYAAADVLVHPSRQESFGLAVAEALASGVPVVTRCGGGADQIAPPWPLCARVEGDSLACWTRSSAAVADALQHDGDNLRRACCDYARTHHSIKRTAAAYLSLYQRISASSPAVSI